MQKPNTRARGDRTERSRALSPPSRPAITVPAGPGFAALALALLVAGLLAMFPDPDPDLWWHLKTGELISREQTIPRTDPFTYTAEGQTWVTHEWLTEVVLHRVHQAGGGDLLIVLRAFLVISALGLGAAAALVGGPGRERIGATALGVLLAAPLIATRAFARPHLFTAVLLGATLLLLRLDSVRGARPGRRWCRWALLPLFALWANLHSGFVLGLALVALYWIGEAVGERTGRGAQTERRAWHRRALLFGLLTLATLINPHHVHALLYPFQLVARPEVRAGIVELRPVFHPSYQGALFLPVLAAVAGVLAILFAGSGWRVRWAIVLPGLAFGLMGLRAVRGVTEFGVLVPALFGLHGAWLAGRRPVARALPVLVLVLSAGLAWLALRPGIPMGRDGPRRAGFGISRTMVPDQAALFLRQAGTEGRLFNLLGHGGYLIYQLWPGRQVYVDGRLDVFPRGFLEAYGRMVSTGEGWEEACRRYGITLAVVDQQAGPAGDFGLRRLLRQSPDWSCVHLSHNAIVYARRVGENEALLARFACPFDPVRISVDAIRQFAATAPPTEVARSIDAMAAMAEVTPEDPFLLITRGQLLDAAGRSAEAVEQIRRALEIGPPSVEARLLLAATLLRAGALDQAEVEILTITRQSKPRVETFLLLADLRQRQGDLEAALRAVESARAIQPDHPGVRRALEILQNRPGGPR